MANDAHTARASARDRADRFSPFLRQAAERHSEIAGRFATDGAEAAIAQALELEDDTLEATLRRRREALALAVALGDLAGELTLEQVTAVLSDFADEAIDRALGQAIEERVAGATSTGFAVLALGKLGSCELNYSSDVDLILLYDPATLARRERDDPGESAVRIGRRLVELLQQRTSEGYVARVDLRLRPSPEATPIVLPVGAAISYYESQALAWERAAFIRARACAGDRALGDRFLGEIAPFIWRRALDFGAIEEIRAISAQVRDYFSSGRELGAGYDLKRGNGGIREAEFFTQVRQLIHGGREPALRVPATLDALRALADAGRMDQATSIGISAAYRALRTAEHRIQMIADKQDHCLPATAAGLERLAGLCGEMDSDALIAALAPHVAFVKGEFDSLVSEQKERLPTDSGRLEQAALDMGFVDTAQLVRLIGEWRSGRARALRSDAAKAAFEAMLPSLLEAIASSPDQSRALNRFTDLVEKLPSGVNLFRLLEARPRLASALAKILAHAPALASQLARRPTLLDGLIDESSFAAPPDASTQAERLITVAGRGEYGEALDRVRRRIGERRFALGVQLISGHRDPITIAEGYSDLAEGAIIALSKLTEDEYAAVHGRIPGGALIVLALGRLGGRALTDASDLDLIFLYEAPAGATSDGAKSLSAADYYNRLVSRVVAALGTPTAAGPLYEVDTRLRPQGSQGMLAVSIDAFESYQRSEAWTWEHMALCRARPLTGDEKIKGRVADLICDILKNPRPDRDIAADAAAMRAEMTRHKPPAGPFDIKLGSGGLVDLEFTVHTLQLTSGIGLEPKLELAIAQLARAGLIDAAADSDLRLLSAILVVMRLTAPKQMEPAEASRPLVARLCGHDDWESLVAAVEAARQRIARRWARVAGGEGDGNAG